MQASVENILLELTIVLNGGDIPDNGTIGEESESELRAAVAEGPAATESSDNRSDEASTDTTPDSQEDVDEAISEVAAGGD